jgi:hypothetical protein
MATTRSLQGIDWIVRTYAPTLLTACGQSGKATTVAGGQPITSTARLNSAVTRLNALEAQAKADYAGATWDAAWSQALTKVDAEVWAQCPIPLTEMMVDPDVTVQGAMKTALRGLELNACQFLAGGGVFP